MAPKLSCTRAKDLLPPSSTILGLPKEGENETEKASLNEIGHETRDKIINSWPKNLAENGISQKVGGREDTRLVCCNKQLFGLFYICSPATNTLFSYIYIYIPLSLSR